jgi:hypothetical protein
MNISNATQIEVPVEMQPSINTHKRKRVGLKQNQKATVYLEYTKNRKSYGQIAKQFKCPRSTVSTIVHNGPYDSTYDNERIRKQPSILVKLENCVIKLAEEVRLNKLPLTKSVSKKQYINKSIDGLTSSYS